MSAAPFLFVCNRQRSGKIKRGALRASRSKFFGWLPIRLKPGLLYDFNIGSAVAAGSLRILLNVEGYFLVLLELAESL